MRFFWIISVRSLKQILLILVAALIAAIIAYMRSEQLMVFSTTNGPQAISKVYTDQKQAALTFNISQGDVQPSVILNILKTEGIEATFFVSGSWAQQHPKIIKKIVQDHHDLALLGVSHSDASLTQTERKKNMLRASDIIQKISGKEPELFRAPLHTLNEKVLQAASALGYTSVDWSINSRDLSHPGINQIVNNVASRASSGDIILMHASDAAKQTPGALPIIINELKNEDLQWVTVSELLSNAKTKSKLIK